MPRDRETGIQQVISVPSRKQLLKRVSISMWCCGKFMTRMKTRTAVRLYRQAELLLPCHISSGTIVVHDGELKV